MLNRASRPAPMTGPMGLPAASNSAISNASHAPLGSAVRRLRLVKVTSSVVDGWIVRFWYRADRRELPSVRRSALPTWVAEPGELPSAAPVVPPDWRNDQPLSVTLTVSGVAM